MGRRQFGSVRKLPSGRYQARYTNADGLQVTAPLSFTTKGDAGRWLAAAETDMRRGTFHDPTISQVTFAAWAEEWLGFKQGQRPATLARDRAAIRTHFNPALGAMPIARITPADIRRLVRAMQDSGLAAKSVRTYVGTLQAIFAAAVDTDVITRSPVRTKTLGLRPVVRPVRPTLTPTEVYRLAQAVPPRHRALVLVAGLLGLRWGEAIGLRVSDVDLDARTIAIEQSVEEVAGRVRVVAQLKSDASRRTFAIPASLAHELAAHLAEHRDGAGPDDLVFVGRRGGTLRRSFEARTFKPAVEAAGLPDGLTFHGLRHVAASLMVANGEHPKVIQHRLGHADPAISIGVYSHVSNDVDRQVADRLDLAVAAAVERDCRPPGLAIADPYSGCDADGGGRVDDRHRRHHG